ncbi:MAG: hypothetical protein P8Z31_03105 [Gammaproteobacteria bacterium]|jgi:hypothetical protein
MCGGVEYKESGHLWTVYFPDSEARLPVVTKMHRTRLVTWGRRHYEAGALPLGGWARHESIEEGVWARWNPLPVKIHVRRYMEKDSNNKSHWFDVPPLHVIQGLVASHGEEQRVYIVTVPAEGEFAAIHDRWPRIVQAEPLFKN